LRPLPVGAASTRKAAIAPAGAIKLQEEMSTISTANWFSFREAADQIEKNYMHITHREADMIAGSSLEVIISVGRFSYSPSWNARWRSARAAGLGSRAPCP